MVALREIWQNETNCAHRLGRRTLRLWSWKGVLCVGNLLLFGCSQPTSISFFYWLHDLSQRRSWRDHAGSGDDDAQVPLQSIDRRSILSCAGGLLTDVTTSGRDWGFFIDRTLTSCSTGVLTLTPSTLTFSGYTIGDNPSQRVTVTNTSAAAAGIAGIAISGDPSLTERTNCGTTAAAGETSTVTDTFQRRGQLIRTPATAWHG